MAITSLLILAIGTSYVLTAKVENTNVVTGSVDEITTDIERFMYDSTQCTAAIGGKDFSIDPLSLPTLKGSSGATAFQVGVAYPPKGVSISQMQLTGFNRLETQTGQDRGISTLRLTFSDPSAPANSAFKNFSRSIALLVTRMSAAPSTISTCGALPYENWFPNGVNPGIHSNLLVGVGTASPAAPLEVAGFPVTIGDQSAGGTRLVMSDLGGGYKQLSTTNGASIAFSEASDPYKLLVFDQNRMGVRVNPPLLAQLDIAQSGTTTNVLELGDGELEVWRWALENGGNTLAMRRNVTYTNNGNFVFMGPLSVKNGTPAAGNMLSVNGTAGGSQDWQVASDRRLKTDLERISGALSLLKRLRPVSYRLKESGDGELHYGFIAQELREVLPEVVVEDRDGELSVKMDELIALLVEATRELNDRIAKDQGELDRFLEQICSRHPQDDVCGS